MVTTAQFLRQCFVHSNNRAIHVSRGTNGEAAKTITLEVK